MVGAGGNELRFSRWLVDYQATIACIFQVRGAINNIYNQSGTPQNKASLLLPFPFPTPLGFKAFTYTPPLLYYSRSFSQPRSASEHSPTHTPPPPLLYYYRSFSQPRSASELSPTHPPPPPSLLLPFLFPTLLGLRAFTYALPPPPLLYYYCSFSQPRSVSEHSPTHPPPFSIITIPFPNTARSQSIHLRTPPLPLLYYYRSFSQPRSASERSPTPPPLLYYYHFLSILFQPQSIYNQSPPPLLPFTIITVPFPNPAHPQSIHNPSSPMALLYCYHSLS